MPYDQRSRPLCWRSSMSQQSPTMAFTALLRRDFLLAYRRRADLLWSGHDDILHGSRSFVTLTVFSINYLIEAQQAAIMRRPPTHLDSGQRVLSVGHDGLQAAFVSSSPNGSAGPRVACALDVSSCLLLTRGRIAALIGAMLGCSRRTERGSPPTSS